jgi:hypothetical protein
MTMRYEVVRQDDPALRERLKDLAKVRRRFGYRRLHVFLRREGHEVNHKRLFRIYREEQLHVRRRSGRKRAIGTRAPMVPPLLPNQRWSLDFVSDQFTDGRRFRIMTVVDDCTRECLALIAEAERLAMREGIIRALDTLSELDADAVRQMTEAFVDHFEAQHANLRLLDLEYRLGSVPEDDLLKAYHAYKDASTLVGATAFASVASRLGLNLTRLRPRAALIALR